LSGSFRLCAEIFFEGGPEEFFLCRGLLPPVVDLDLLRSSVILVFRWDRYPHFFPLYFATDGRGRGPFPSLPGVRDLFPNCVVERFFFMTQRCSPKSPPPDKHWFSPPHGHVAHWQPFFLQTASTCSSLCSFTQTAFRMYNFPAPVRIGSPSPGIAGSYPPFSE